MTLKRFILLFFILLSFHYSNSQTSDFTYSPSTGNLCTPQTITFTQASSGSPTAFVWDFGNGERGNEPIESIIYDQQGTYNVTLITVYSNVARSVTKTITINGTPGLTLTADKLQLCTPGPVVFTANTGGSISSWQWDFGDGSPVQTTSTNTITHNFANYGSFRTEVKVTSAQGCINTAALNIEIAKFPLTATLTSSDSCIPVSTTFQVNATMIPGDTRQSILWEFGDGTPNALNNFANFTHTYNTTNNITAAKITVTTTQGCVNEYTFPPFAYGIPPTGINAYTTALRDTFCGSETVQFYANATNANLYTWNFGGEIRSTTSNNISNKFMSLGNQNVIVTPSFNGCKGTPDTVKLYIEGVIAFFDIWNTCNQKNSYKFINNSLGNVSHFEWTYPDSPGAIDSTNFTATHTFPPVGTFYTHLFLVDSITGCIDSLRKPIYTARPTFTSNTNIVCKDSLLVYNVNGSYPLGTGYQYEYHVNGQTIVVYDSIYLPINPTSHGIFNDYVVIHDNLLGTCSDTIQISIPTKVRGPVSTIDVPDQLCADTAVTIINNSHPFFPGENIVKWRWSFNDGKFDSIQHPPPHQYRYGGMYTIELISTDINGCGNRTDRLVWIHPLPKVNILPKWDTLCLGQSLELIAYSSDSITWSPTTNISCIGCDTTMVSPSTSTDYVALATSIYGCDKRDTAYIKVFAPFNLSVTPRDTSICPGGSVLYNLNKGGTVLWTPSTYLSSSTSKTPVSRPLDDINYKVTVTDSVGCFTDSAFATINIFDSAKVDAGPDLILDYETPYTLNPVYSSGITNYLWTPSQTLSCSSCPSPSGVIKNSFTFTINVSDINGCKASDEINVKLNCGTAMLYVPTAFTPNGDGLNDYFYPISRGFEKIISFSIYNRNGYKLFERRNLSPNEPSMGWDGSFKGMKDLNTQSFVWFAEIDCDGTRIVKKGSFTLIR